MKISGLFSLTFLLSYGGLAQSHLTPEKQLQIDSLNLIIETAKNDTMIILAWKAWAKLVRKSDKALSLELHQKVIDRCETRLYNVEAPPPERERRFYQKELAGAHLNMGNIYSDQGAYAQAIDLYTKCQQISEQTGDPAHTIKALNNIGNVYSYKGEFLKAIEFYQESLQISEETADSTGIAKAFHAIGYAYSNLGNLTQALEYYNLGRNIREKLNDQSGIAQSFNNIGIVLEMQGNYAEAIDFYIRSLKIKEQLGDKNGIAQSMNNIGLIYGYQQEYDKALDYYNRCILIWDELENNYEKPNTLINIGNIYFEKEAYVQALDYYHQSLVIQEQMEDQFGIAFTVNNIGSVYLKQGNFAQAIDFFNRSLQIRKDLGDKAGMAVSFYSIGDYYKQKGYSLQAIPYAKEAYKLAKEVGELEYLKVASQLLYECYKETGNTTLALQMHEQYISARDSLESEANQREVIRQEYKYNYEKQALADSIKNAQLQKVKDAELATERAISQQQRQRSWFLLGGLGLALLFGGLIFKQKKQVEVEKNKSDNLLLNILPKETAEELKEKGSVAAQSFQMASVLFTDFKGFTTLAEQMTPEQLVQELNYCFSAFDRIVQQHGIEKIKTIGDAYMAVGGVPVSNSNHALKTLETATEIQSFMSSRANELKQKELPFFEIRIGIHSGPLVAGVVGTQKFQYDVWGDTVNVASRMESSGETGQINISEATYGLVKNSAAFSFIPRGQVEAKGKGAMRMYFARKNH